MKKRIKYANDMEINKINVSLRAFILFNKF